jgi:hypothetical protein
LCRQHILFVAARIFHPGPSSHPQRTTHSVIRFSSSKPGILQISLCSWCRIAFLAPLMDRGSTSYYIFPNFAQLLYEYVRDPVTTDTVLFSEYYSLPSHAGQNHWVVKQGSPEVYTRLTPPCFLLRRSWRWAEVLEGLWSV